MESNQMLELRYKRLNYYNKLISNESPPATAEAIATTATNNNNSNEILSFETAPINFIDNFFESTPNPNNTNRIYNNKKLEEFKKVVESSYNIHVIKKSDQLVKSSVESVIPNKNIFTNQLSLSDSLPNSSRADQETTSYRSNDTMNNTTLTCKIPYMSAYNIYNEEKSNNNLIRRMSDSSTTTQEAYIEKFNPNNNQDNNQLILQTLRKMSISSNEEQQLQHKQQINVTTTLEKKLSSNGSSLNTSPTSQSSSSSSLVNNNVLLQQQQQPAIQVKPPDKPRTQSVASYRKNLLKLSLDSIKADQSKSLDLNKQTNHESIKLSDSLEISPKPTYTRDNFFNNQPTNKAIKIKKTKTKSIKKQKNSIFNFVNDYDDEQEEKAKAEDNFSDEDKNDTFDIFSSEENLEKTIQENFTSNNKDIDLKIDLGCLSDQHDEEEHENINKKSKIINFADSNDYDEDYSIIIENDKLTSNRITSGRQNQLQTKPENIPNLMLDLMDDEKSTQSVTASLAKSMCKEIDYQKEMEILYTLGSKNTAEPIQQSALKSQRDQRLLTNIKKNNNNNNFKKPTNPTNFTSQLNSLAVPNKIKTQVPEYFKVDLTKPPPQPRSSSALSARNLTTTAHTKIIKQEYVRPESAASGSFVHNYDRNKSRIKLNRIDLTNQNNNNDTTSKFNQVKKTKNFLSVSKDFKNQNKPSLAKNRPSSAMSNPKYSDISDSEMTVPDPPNRSKSSLFFDYSKLISIETNLKQEEEKEEEKLKLTSEFLNTLGDQDAYKQIFLNNENESKFEARWLELPDEIWLRIIKTLPHKDLVQFGACCKKFKNLYLDNSLWRKITMKYKYDVKGEWLEWIGKRRPNELNIVQCNGNLSLNSIVEMFRMIGDELQVLNLSRCSNVSLSGDNFALQASIRCPNITNLDLSWTLLSNQTLKLIADSFRKIESINLSGCSMIGEDGFNFLITKHGEWLKNLEISGCIHFSSNCVLNIGAYCRGLERLNISNCHRMTNESIMEACPQWLKLKFLDLRGIKTIKNNCVSTIVRRCNRIESLALGECIQLSDACMLEIATYKPNIKYLDINGCKKITDNSIRSLANFCLKLEFLNLRATNITDIGLITLINGKCVKTLEDLNLSYLPVSEAILIKLLKNQTNLKRIHLYGCYNIKKLDEIKKLTASENKVIFNI